MFCCRQRGDVLRRVAGRLHQPDTVGKAEALSRSGSPLVGLVDGPVIVDPSIGKESDVHGVVGMVMGDDDVCDLGRRDLERGQRIEYRRVIGNQSRINDGNDRRIAYQAHCAGDPVASVAREQHID